MADDVLQRAKALLGKDYVKKELPAGSGSLAKARDVLGSSGILDVYLVFDTTCSMSSYIDEVRANISQVTGALLDGKADIRLSINGVGDHCDGADVLQMYALTKDSSEAFGSIDSIVMTHGGDEPEAYECAALALAKRLPVESSGRKRAVVFVGDSYPHGMKDGPCVNGVDYEKAFEALKTVADGFYLVGCNQQTYAIQKQLINPGTGREQFIPLGDMVDALPTLLVALAKKTESEKALAEYMQLVERQTPAIAGKVRGMLTR